MTPTSSIPSNFTFQKRVLVAPLNWGLGHATRCIPLIRALECMGASVFLASDGAAYSLLRNEFPHLPLFRLPSYHIRYKGANMIRNIAGQLPRILFAIAAEKSQTEKIVRREGIQGILSDNRYGCHSRNAHNILLTHQIHLKIPHRLLERLTNRVLRRAFTPYDAIWVPDAASSPGLSGELSHPAISKTAYIGALSRYSSYAFATAVEYDAAIVLSGPEPQRSHLEQILLDQAKALPYRFIFVLGKPNEHRRFWATERVEIVSHLTSSDLQKVISRSRVVVCRSGYSSIMDLAAIGKPALLIPTPGQTEQEYLANLHSSRGRFAVQYQESLHLETGLKEAFQHSGMSFGPVFFEQYRAYLQQWVGRL